MSVHIIIDGYNFIRQSMSTRLLNTRDLQQERSFLINSLVAYKRRKAHAVTVVFDGTRAPFDLVRKERVQGVDVVFSPVGQTADAVIKTMAARERERALVVSSDREIADFVSAQGAVVIDCVTFENKLYLLTEDDGETPPSEDAEEEPRRPFTTRKKGPAFRLSKKQRQTKKKTRKL